MPVCSLSSEECQDTAFGRPGTRMCCVIFSSDREDSVYERVTLSMVLSVECGEQYRCITKSKDKSVQWLCLGEASRGPPLHWVPRRIGWRGGLWITGGRAVGKGERPSGGTCNNTIPLPLAVSWSPRRILPRPEPGISEKAENLGSLCSLGLPSRAQASDDEHDAGMANKSPEFNWSRNTRHPMFRATSAP